MIIYNLSKTDRLHYLVTCEQITFCIPVLK
uniref:Uncharacterized protein n=1 Tax=Anguilla anguilla TaxID=7936 RepID=A0A0E9TM30_ANGAN